MAKLFLDLETFNTEPIQNGTYKYSETVKILLFAYAVDNTPAKVWDVASGAKMPAELRDIIETRDTVFIAHNSNFDRNMLKRFSNRFADPNNWEDTMVMARLHGLPGGLEMLCSLFKVGADKAKDAEGKKLVQMFCMPHPHWKIPVCTRRTHPEEWSRFVNYARLDVEAMRELYRLIPHRNYTKQELELWRMDQRINDRGIFIDKELVDSAIEAVDEEQARLKKNTNDMTDGLLESTTMRDAFLNHILMEYGIVLKDARASTLERRLDDPELPEGVKELIRVRLMATTSSTAKYKKLKKLTSSDGYLRGSLQFAGASRTLRWAGYGFQPQNLARPTIKDVEAVIEILKSGCGSMLLDNVMEAASSALRGVIIPSPGKKFVVADLANIEGRVQAWLAGEEWKLRAFRDYDTIIGRDKEGEPIRKGHDLYAIAYAKMFGVTPESVMEDKKAKGNQRQVGKTAELACLGADTKVLTNTGIKRIVEVSISDLLWNGNDWVSHEGVVCRGYRETCSAGGISATTDHRFLSNGVWLPWGFYITAFFREYLVKERYELTYDIVNAANGNMFTILDEEGKHHLVHNCGYGGGVGSFVTFATSFGLSLGELADSAYDKIDQRILDEAYGLYEYMKKKKRTLSLDQKTWVVMDSFKRQWRETHPNISSGWKLLEDTIRMALQNPRNVFKVMKCEIEFTGKWLFIKRPSGRYLCYPDARMDESGGISYMGISQYTKKWERIKTHGGKIFENLVQGLSRDVMADNMPLLIAAGYDIVLSVHDELISETEDTPDFNLEGFCKIFTRVPEWAKGLPLAADGYESYRYRKG